MAEVPVEKAITIPRRDQSTDFGDWLAIREKSERPVVED